MKGAAMPIHTLHACLESVQLCWSPGARYGSLEQAILQTST